MRFDYIKIGFWPGNGWRIQWRADGLDVTSQILIQRAEGPDGPFTDVATAPYDQVTYEDCVLEFQGIFNNLWYKLTILDGSGDPVLVSNAQSVAETSDRITSEIIRQHELLLYGTNTHPGYYPRALACFKAQKTTGKYEASMGWNGESALGFSEADQNTGFNGGYTTPTLFMGRWIDVVNKQTATQATGSTQELSRQLWTSNYPILEAGDLIAEKGTGRVWEVRSISVREPNNILVSQTAYCSLIDHHLYEAQRIFYPGDE